MKFVVGILALTLTSVRNVASHVTAHDEMNYLSKTYWAYLDEFAAKFVRDRATLIEMKTIVNSVQKLHVCKYCPEQVHQITSYITDSIIRINDKNSFILWICLIHNYSLRVLSYSEGTEFCGRYGEGIEELNLISSSNSENKNATSASNIQYADTASDEILFENIEDSESALGSPIKQAATALSSFLSTYTEGDIFPQVPCRFSAPSESGKTIKDIIDITTSLLINSTISTNNKENNNNITKRKISFEEALSCYDYALQRCSSEYESSKTKEKYFELEEVRRLVYTLGLLESSSREIGRLRHSDIPSRNEFNIFGSMDEFEEKPLPDNSIAVFDDMLSETQCDSLVTLMDESEMFIGNQLSPTGEIVYDFTQKKASEFSVSTTAARSVQCTRVDRLLLKTTQEALLKYEKLNPAILTLVNPMSDEGFRLKRYLNDDTEFHDYHIDGFHDQPGFPVRIIAVLIYFNNVSEGGETVFLQQGKKIEPRCGRVVMFPTSYTHVHGGRKPISDHKYIAATFITV